MSGRYTFIHAVEIDLTKPKEKIIEDFWQKVESLKKANGQWHLQKQKGQKKDAVRRDFMAWFRDLAIYRLSLAGFRSKEQMNLISTQPAAKLVGDFQNWNHKAADTEKRIGKRFSGLKTCARILPQFDAREGSRWFDHFVRL